MPLRRNTDDDALQERPRGVGPHFICIGPKKTATTWLADQLKLHTDIWLTPIQELSYLSTGSFTRHRDAGLLERRIDWWSMVKQVVRNKSVSSKPDQQFYEAAQELAATPAFDLDLYRRLFAPARGRISGDISPIYASLTFEEIQRARRVVDVARVFMIARDPVGRFWSELSMHRRKKSFGDVDYGSVEIVRSFFQDPERQRQHFLSDIVSRWRSAIGNSLLKIFYFDDIAADPAASLHAIVDYIGGDYRKRIPVVRPGYNRKRGNEKLVPSCEVSEWVREAFQDELRACADLFPDYGEKWLRKHSRRSAGVKTTS